MRTEMTRNIFAAVTVSAVLASTGQSFGQTDSRSIDPAPQTRETEPAVGPRAYDPPRVIERDRGGEDYVAGFGGFTLKGKEL